MKTFIIILFLPQSLGYFGALAVSGFSLGILTAAGGPVKGIAYCMNGNGEEPEEWPHADGITICIPRDIERNNRWATINNDIKREAEERIDEYNGRTIRRRGDRIHIDNKDLIHVNGYIHVRIQLNQKRWPSTFAGVNHRPNVPMEHVRDGLRKSLSKKKLYELKEAEQAH